MVGTPSACIAELITYSRNIGPTVARPSPPRAKGVRPEPFRCRSRRRPDAVDDLTEEQGATIAELGRIAPELMAGVGHGDRFGAGRNDVADEHPDALGRSELGLARAEFGGQVGVEGEQFRRRRLGRLPGHEQTVELAHEGVVEREGHASMLRAVRKRKPMNVINTPVAAVRYGPSITSWATGKTTMPTCAAGERPRDREHRQQRPDRHQGGHGREHHRAAHERQHAAPAAESREDRPGVPDHRRTRSDVRHPPHARRRDRHTDERRDRPLGDVTDEDRERRLPAECRPRVPVPGVVIADVAEVDRRTDGGPRGWPPGSTR